MRTINKSVLVITRLSEEVTKLHTQITLLHAETKALRIALQSILGNPEEPFSRADWLRAYMKASRTEECVAEVEALAKAMEEAGSAEPRPEESARQRQAQAPATPLGGHQIGSLEWMRDVLEEFAVLTTRWPYFGSSAEEVEKLRKKLDQSWHRSHAAWQELHTLDVKPSGRRYPL